MRWISALVVFAIAPVAVADDLNSFLERVLDSSTRDFTSIASCTPFAGMISTVTPDATSTCWVRGIESKTCPVDQAAEPTVACYVGTPYPVSRLLEHMPTTWRTVSQSVSGITVQHSLSGRRAQLTYAESEVGKILSVIAMPGPEQKAVDSWTNVPSILADTRTRLHTDLKMARRASDASDAPYQKNDVQAAFEVASKALSAELRIRGLHAPAAYAETLFGVQLKRLASAGNYVSVTVVGNISAAFTSVLDTLSGWDDSELQFDISVVTPAEPLMYFQLWPPGYEEGKRETCVIDGKVALSIFRGAHTYELFRGCGNDPVKRQKLATGPLIFDHAKRNTVNCKVTKKSAGCAVN